jgi:predicted  nucleic acid-binding Zn-ribbon protein
MTVSAAVLRELHRILRQLTDLRSRLQRGPRQIQTAEANVQRSEQEVAAAKERVLKTRMACDQRELTLREREGRIVDVKVRLNSCSTNREYQAFLEQIAADETANSVLSDEILELLDKLTELQEAAKLVQSQREKLIEDMQSVRQRVEKERGGLEMDLARLTGELAEVEGRLPADFRAVYQRLVKARGEEALAPLDGECCGGCFQTVTPQTFNDLMLSKPVFCKSCGCIMYLPEDRERK